MSTEKGPERQIPVKLSEAQRKTLAELLPALAERLKLDEPGQRSVSFTPTQLNAVVAKATTGIPEADSGVKRNSLRHVLASAEQAASRFEQAASVYRLKLTLLDARPPVWRQVRVHDCTLDELH